MNPKKTHSITSQTTLPNKMDISKATPLEKTVLRASEFSKCTIFGGWLREHVRGSRSKDMDLLCSKPENFIAKLLEVDPTLTIEKLEVSKGYYYPDRTFRMTIANKEEKQLVDVVDATTYEPHLSCNALVYNHETARLYSGAPNVSTESIIADIKKGQCRSLRRFSSDMMRMQNKGWKIVN
jgi:hypothetical protein